MFQNELVPRLIEVPEKGTDFDSRVLDAYINQCTAEAQEGPPSYFFTQKIPTS